MPNTFAAQAFDTGASAKKTQLRILRYHLPRQARDKRTVDSNYLLVGGGRLCAGDPCEGGSQCCLNRADGQVRNAISIITILPIGIN
eukprot:COSAG06_NODE_4289_length_4396_cov_2.229230_3_plen_87_part_00